MKCHPGCYACCVAISIKGPIPGVEGMKQGGVPCPHLNKENLCSIYPQRPDVCRNFSPTPEFCGNSPREAMERLAELERQTG